MSYLKPPQFKDNRPDFLKAPESIAPFAKEVEQKISREKEARQNDGYITAICPHCKNERKIKLKFAVFADWLCAKCDNLLHQELKRHYKSFKKA